MARDYTKDLELARGCLEHEPSAWADLVSRYETTVYFAIQNAFRIHHVEVSGELVTELQAEVFYRLVRDRFAKLRHYRGRCSLRHWLKVVSGNFVIDYLRKRRPEYSLNDPDCARLQTSLVDSAPTPEESVERLEAREIVRQLWEELQPADRRFAELFYEQELTFDEIAEVMETTVGAIYSRKNRVRKKLAALMKRRQTVSKGRRRRV